MWSVVAVLLIANLTSGSQFYNGSLINLETILFWQKSQSEISPQFALGVSIGLKLLKGSSVLCRPEVKTLLRKMQSIEDEFHRGRNRDRGTQLIISLVI